MEPRHLQLQGPPLSAKVPFVRFDPADWMLSADKTQTDYRNIILEITVSFSMHKYGETNLVIYLCLANSISDQKPPAQSVPTKGNTISLMLRKYF